MTREFELARDEIAALAADLAERALCLADACKDLTAHRTPDADPDALTAPHILAPDFEGEDG